MIHRPAIWLRLALASLLVFAAWAALSQTSQPGAAHNELVIKNAYVMTVTHGNIKNGSIYVKDGKIVAVGPSVDAPASAAVVDAGGRYVTPGIIDAHSHRAGR